MKQLVILKGLPASGKSTYAKELVAKGYKRINKDDLRAMIDNSSWSRQKETMIKTLEKDIVKGWLKEGLDVVVDDTNFAYIEMWSQLAEELTVQYEVVEFNVPIYELLKRDLKRANSVGGSVILNMYERYLKPHPRALQSGLENCYVFDMDGTLALMGKRSPYDFTKVSEDTPNRDVVNIAKKLSETCKIIIVSGREETCKFDTHKWLFDNGIEYSELHMREEGDTRKDNIIKKEIFEEHLTGYNILGVFDDRNQVTDMWRSLGLTVFQVNYGDF